MKGPEFFPYGIVAPSEFPDTADKLLDEFMEITEQLEMRTYLAFGLCLGLFRDGKYIPGDNDLDFVVITKEINDVERLTRAMQSRGFNMGLVYPLPANNKHFYKGRILIDVYFRTEGQFYCGSATVNYNGKEYPIPFPVTEYLSSCYKNWLIPSDETSAYYG